MPNYLIEGSFKIDEPWSEVINGADDVEQAKEWAMEKVRDDNPDALQIEVENTREIT